MDAYTCAWADLPEDSPIELLTRKTVKGERMMVARVALEKGCHVKCHRHESEQISVMVSGRAIWRIGDDGSPDRREVTTTGGEIIVLPSNVAHSVDVLEDAVFIDILSPIGPMGVDSQGKR